MLDMVEAVQDPKQFLIETHSRLTIKEQAKALGISHQEVSQLRIKLYSLGQISVCERAYLPEWSKEDEEFLAEHYSSAMSMRQLCSHLKRSRVAITLKKKRLRIRRTDDIYTARVLADLFGEDSHFWPRLVEEDFIKAEHARWKIGLYHPWVFDEEEVERFLRRYPFLVRRFRVDGHYFRSVLDNEWVRDPWFTPIEAARYLGCHTETVRRGARRGVIRGFQRSPKSRWSFWWFRKSDLEGAREILHRYHIEQMSLGKKFINQEVKLGKRCKYCRTRLVGRFKELRVCSKCDKERYPGVRRRRPRKVKLEYGTPAYKRSGKNRRKISRERRKIDTN